MKLDSVLAAKGYIKIPADYGVWILEAQVVLIVHVDDMQMFGTREGIDTLVAVLELVFILKWQGATGEEPFLGLSLERDRVNRSIMLSQAHYAEQILKRFGMEACAEVQTPME